MKNCEKCNKEIKAVDKDVILNDGDGIFSHLLPEKEYRFYLLCEDCGEIIDREGDEIKKYYDAIGY